MYRLIFVLMLVLSVMPASRLVSQTRPQPGWSWPDSMKNRKVLPSDTNAQKLRAVMTGFTRALGVRCTHCHVGKEGEPLETYDFVSDKNPKKDVARGMYKMLGVVNDELKRIQPNKTDRVNMWCNTCHHGLAQPRTLAEELTLVYDKSGADSTVTRYKGLRSAHEISGAYDFREPSLNMIGFHALEKEDGRGALALLKLNAEYYPESGRVHELLGQAYITAGDTAQAIAEFERSKKLDPKNAGATKALEELKKR